MNTKYGRLSNGRIEYAPVSLDTEDGVKMNPSEASYLAAGWKKVVDVRPTAEPGSRVILGVNARELSQMIGQNRGNLDWLRERFSLASLSVRPADVKSGEIRRIFLEK